MTIGIVYVALNVGFPGRCKIGRTSREADTRIGQLQRHYGTPHPFAKYCAYMVPDYTMVEALAHRRLAHCRDYKTEMFVCTAEEAKAAVLWAHAEVLKQQIKPRADRGPERRWAARSRPYKDGSWTILTAIALCGIGVWVVREKPELPNWLPQSVAHVVMLLERMSPN